MFKENVNISCELNVLFLPRNAYGEIAPFLMETMIVMPDSRNGDVRSMTSLRTWLITNDVIIISALPSRISFTKPFHSPSAF